jgi:hypothetical protein
MRGLAAAPPPRRAHRPAQTESHDQPRPDERDVRTEHSDNHGPAQEPKPAATSRQRQRRPSTRSSDELPGRNVGNKRALVAQLPATVREALDAEVAQSQATKGIVIMRALREQYDRLTPQAKRRPEPSGPFPPERPLTRRRTVSNRVPTTYTLWPDECDAIVKAANQLGVNLSQLVTDALNLRYELGLDALHT